MVPAVALADEAVEPVQDDGLELLATGTQSFNAASLTKIKIDGKSYDTTSSITVKVNTEGAAFAPVQAKLPTGETVDLTAKDADSDAALYEVVFYANNNGKKGDAITETDDIAAIGKTAGTYFVSVAATDANTDYPEGVISSAVKVTFEAPALEGVDIFEVQFTGPNNDGEYTPVENYTDKTFVFDSTDFVKGKLVTKGETEDGNQYLSSIWYTIDGVAAIDELADPVYYAAGSGTAAATPVTKIINAGKYIAYLDGAGDYAGCDPVQIAFEVKALDLSTANIVMGDIDANHESAYVKSINGITDQDTINKLVKVVKADDSSIVTTKGAYEFTVLPADGINVDQTTEGSTRQVANVINSKTVTVNKVTASLTNENFFYGVSDWGNAFDGNAITIDHSKSDADFDPAQISVYSEIDAETGKPVASSKLSLADGEYAVTYTDADGVAETAADLTKPGTHIVTVTVNSGAEDIDYDFGGTATVEVTVTEGTVTAATVFTSYDGVATNEIEAIYTGQDILDDVNIVVKAGRKTLTEGSDYKVIVKDSKGKEVDEVVNVLAEGVYTVFVESDTYDVPSTPVATIEVIPATSTQFRLAGLKSEVTETKTGNQKYDIYTSYIQYTGSDITPVIEATSLDADDEVIVDANENPIWNELDSDSYKLTYKYREGTTGKWTDVDSINEKGYYQITIAQAKEDINSVIAPATQAWENLSNTHEAATKAVDVANGALVVQVKDNRRFIDVPASEWYFDVVEAAADNGYMTGIGGTDFFAPYENLTRAQAAQVIFNMAGGAGFIDEGMTQNEAYYSLPFADTDGGAWYAKAVYWANGAGIVTGYDEGSVKVFDPEGSVTREQFALMMQRFAKLKGDDTTATGDLADYADAAAVDDWAVDGVRWAVAAGIMGQNTNVLNPVGNIARAEAAAMTVRYQPKAL